MSNEVLNQYMMMEVLNTCYEKAVNALPKAEDIFNKSCIGKVFRNKRFDNFDFQEV